MFTRTHSFSRSLAFYFLSAFLAFSLSRIQAQTEWTLRNPAPCDTPLGGLAFGADRFVAVGNEGAILTSEDGENWVKQLILEGRPNLTRLIFAQS